MEGGPGPVTMRFGAQMFRGQPVAVAAANELTPCRQAKFLPTLRSDGSGTAMTAEFAGSVL